MSETLYQSLIIERSRAPLYAGRMVAFDAEGQCENRMCGDEVMVFYKRHGAFWRHEAQGCAILTASADLMCEALSGKDETEISPLHEKFELLVQTGETVEDLGDLNALASIARYPARLRCATLPWHAATNALNAANAAGQRYV